MTQPVKSTRRFVSRWHTPLFALVAFVGGALCSGLSHATSGDDSPYAPLSQLARVLVAIENQHVDPVQRGKLLNGAIKGMVAELDPHSAYMTAEDFRAFNEDTAGSFGGIGVEVDFKDDHAMVIAPVPGAPADRAGIKSGDKIIAVDGKLLRGMAIDKIVRLMRGPENTGVRITVSRAGTSKPIHFNLTREHIHVRSAEGKRLANDVAYLRLKQFQQGSHRELLEEIGKIRQATPQALRGVILDLRSNPGGLVNEAEAIADEFLSGGGIYSTRHRGKVLDDAHAHFGGALTDEPIVILVNEYSASSSELVAGALQDHGRAKIVGAQTFGKGSVQTILQLPGGTGLRLTTMRYYTPNGRAIQANGVKPDVLVRYDEDDAQALSVSERDLDGHLKAEGSSSNGKAAVVKVGKKRPKYRAIDKLPVDPRGSSDYALEVAYEMLAP